MTRELLGMAGEGWVPDVCTLPTAERPLRVGEFDSLFARGLRDVERSAPTELRLTLDSAVEATARDLVARETACCSFFGFAFSSDDGRLLLKVSVPQAHIDVLDGLAARAVAST
jgi:hypothetical protein